MVERWPFPPAFGLVWLGQVASAFGSGLTTFALSVWVYQQSQSLLQFGLVVFANAATIALAAPWVGVVCDRYPRQRVMLASDSGAAGLSALVLVLVSTAQLQLWHVLGVVVADAVLTTMHQVAWRSLVPTMVPRERLANANGLIETGLATSSMLAPLAAGFLLVSIDVQGIVLIDLATFVVAVVTLWIARIPASAEAEELPARMPWTTAMRAGWTYLRERPELVRLLGIVVATGGVMAGMQVLFTPMVLARHDEATLGLLLTAGSAGMVLGGVRMIMRRGPVDMGLVFGAQGLMALCLVALGLSSSAWLWGMFAFLLYALSQQGSIAVRTIWQYEIADDMRGRVFALVSAVSAAVLPLAYLGAPWLAQHVLAPWLATDRGLAQVVAALVGRGPAAGAAVVLGLMGLALALGTLLSARSPGWQPLVRRLSALPTRR